MAVLIKSSEGLRVMRYADEVKTGASSGKISAITDGVQLARSRAWRADAVELLFISPAKSSLMAGTVPAARGGSASAVGFQHESK